MRHRKAGVKLKRDLSARRALLRGLVTNVIEEERITTTVPKAKAAKPLVEKMITLAKKDSLHARRQAAAFLVKPEAVEKLFEKLGPRFNQQDRNRTRCRQGKKKRFLMLNPRRVLTRAQILDHVWNYDFGGDSRVVETYISYLRKKIDAEGPPLIHTVRGVGYSLRLPKG